MYKNLNITLTLLLFKSLFITFCDYNVLFFCLWNRVRSGFDNNVTSLENPSIIWFPVIFPTARLKNVRVFWKKGTVGGVTETKILLVTAQVEYPKKITGCESSIYYILYSFSSLYDLDSKALSRVTLEWNR